MNTRFSVRKMIFRYKMKKNRRISKLPYVWWSCAIFFVSIIFFVLSFVYKYCNWLSNLFLSVGSGAITGVVLYYLSNLRGNKKNRLQIEINKLESLHTEVLKVLYFHIFAESKMKEDDTKTKYEVLRDIISDIEECMSDFPENLYNNLGLYKDNPFDHDKLKYILGEFNGPSDQSIISGFSETLKPTDSKIQEVLEEKKQQLEFINTRII